MSIEDLISEITSKCSGISREKVLAALDEEKTKTAGLIADSTLLRLIARKLCVEISTEKVPARTLSTKILVPRLNDVIISGRIIATYPTKSFEGEKPGRFASLMLADKHGTIRVMLWNDKADCIESGMLAPGQVVRFSHAYTREDRDSKIELHLGEKSEIEVNPSSVQGADFPSLEQITVNVSQIDVTCQAVHLKGRVKNTYELSTFTRQDQTTGQVLHFTLTDEINDVRVLAWGEKAGELAQTITQNAAVRLFNARVKLDSCNNLEVHVDAGTYAEVLAR